MTANQTTQFTAFNPEANNQPYIPTKSDLNFEPALTMEQVQKHESNNDINVRRRMVMLCLTKSGQELYDGLIKDEDGELLVELMEQTSEYISYLKAALELAESVEARLYIVASVSLQEIEDKEQK